MPKTYPRHKTHPAIMGSGYRKPRIVIDGNRVMEYVGIGWIHIRDADAEDHKKYPILVEDKDA